LSSTGFTVGTEAAVNASGGTYVSWSWKGGGTAVSNTDGSITSSVSANPTAGFSVVGYTSPNTTVDETIGHGLSAAPELVIAKNLDQAYNWDVYTPALSSGYDLILNTNAAQGSGRWSTTAPTASLVTLKYNYEHASTNEYIAYCFHSVEGYSKVGSFTGTGVVDGPFIYTGFKPAMIIVKKYSASGNQWYIFDSTRDPYNAAGAELYPSTNGVEWYGPQLDFVSNGVKVRNNYTSWNGSGTNMIYIAFAESPFKTSRAR
jgi:hypothetical protein